jgi:steroid 5-alpha reductase family enzyme
MPLILLFFGLRLGGYLFLRGNVNAKSCLVPLEQRQAVVVPVNHPPSSPSLKGKLEMWISSSLLFVCFAWPARVVALSSGRASFLWQLVMLVAMLLEALADFQKASAKKLVPNKFVSNGLFTLCRHPNHFVELVMYYASLFAAAGLCSWFDLFVCLLGISAITAIIYSGVKRLDAKQFETYRNDEQFLRYFNSTSKLIPFIL